MGQYYKPLNIETMEWVYSHNYGDGLKLMEHSYVGNKFVGAVMDLMTEGKRWHKKPIVWCGDYAEEGYYKQAIEKNKITPDKWMSEARQKRAILVNYTKKEYTKFYTLPLNKVKKAVVDRLLGNDEWVINPLPLLTALGNGQGGGDYSGTNMDKVGIWAHDILSVEFKAPDGFKELKVDFKEE